MTCLPLHVDQVFLINLHKKRKHVSVISLRVDHFLSLSECCVRAAGGMEGRDTERRAGNGNQRQVNTKTGFRSSLWGFNDGLPSTSNALLTFA